MGAKSKKTSTRLSTDAMSSQGNKARIKRASSQREAAAPSAKTRSFTLLGTKDYEELVKMANARWLPRSKVQPSRPALAKVLKDKCYRAGFFTAIWQTDCGNYALKNKDISTKF